MKTCVFAGSFDPITTGHYQTVKKCLEIFDKVVVAVGINPDKQPFFSDNERLQIIKEAFREEERVEVKEFSGLLVDFMKQNGYTIYVRGIRNQDDYTFESTMEKYNKDMYPQLITLFIPSAVSESYVSSTAVRTVISLGGEYEKYLPKSAIEITKKIVSEKTKKK